MSKSSLKTAYISEIDTFLNDFDRENPGVSASQQAEIDKFRRIAALRDQASPATSPDHSTTTLWEKF